MTEEYFNKIDKGMFAPAEVVINDLFYKSLKEKTNEEPLNSFLQIDIKTVVDNVYIFNSSIKDTFYFNEVVKIVGVVKDFSFLNTPKIYYSHLAFKNYLSFKQAIPGSTLPSKSSKEAPPPVEIWLILSA